MGVILLNTLFNGDYINDEVGGEIINMYQSDNGHHYVYITPYGNIDRRMDNKVSHVLFIRTIAGGFVKVIGKAEVERQICLNRSFHKNNLLVVDSDQKRYIDENKITYCGIKAYKLGSWSSYYVTFKVKGVYKSKKDIYLSTMNNNNNHELYDNLFVLDKVNRINNSSQKLYVDEYKNVESYRTLNQIIEDSTFWEINPVSKIYVKESKVRDRGLLSIIKKENDELVNSNLLAYFLENDKKFWSDFAQKVLKISDKKIIEGTPKIIRERIGNIDLFIEVDGYAIVIENKIKSGINDQRENGFSQLARYVEEAEKHVEEKGMEKEVRFYILRPNYNNENYINFSEGNRYKEIKYSDIYKIIKDRRSDFYLNEFKIITKKHSSEYNNEFFEVMNERFIEQIEVKQKKC